MIFTILREQSRYEVNIVKKVDECIMYKAYIGPVKIGRQKRTARSPVFRKFTLVLVGV